MSRIGSLASCPASRGEALKSVLVEQSVPFRKTHDLVVLSGLVPAPLATDLETVDLLLLLQPWAIDGRYPGDLPDASAAEAVAVVEAASEIIVAVERWLARDE